MTALIDMGKRGGKVGGTISHNYSILLVSIPCSLSFTRIRPVLALPHCFYLIVLFSSLQLSFALLLFLHLPLSLSPSLYHCELQTYSRTLSYSSICCYCLLGLEVLKLSIHLFIILLLLNFSCFSFFIIVYSLYVLSILVNIDSSVSLFEVSCHFCTFGSRI